jgi:hypothetical protein
MNRVEMIDILVLTGVFLFILLFTGGFHEPINGFVRIAISLGGTWLFWNYVGSNI